MNHVDLIRRLKECEKVAKELDVTPDEFAKNLDSLKKHSERFLNELPNESAYFPDPNDNWKSIRKRVSSKKGTFDNVLHEFFDSVVNNGINTSSGRFFGYIPGGGVPLAAIGDYLSALTNRYSGFFFASPGATEIENTVIRWLIEMTGFHKQGWGTLQSGGTLATLTAILAMRSTRPWREWPKSVIYCTDQAHHALHRALEIAGLHQVTIENVKVDEQLRMSCDHLMQLIQRDRRRGKRPWAVVASAGTTNTGAIDPLHKISQICKSKKLWFHVDAAYGGFFILTDQARPLLKEMAQADSLVLDPHKGLFLPYGTGAVLIRSPRILLKTFHEKADYLSHLDEELKSPANCSPELTRHFRGLRLWLAMKVHGIEPFRAALEEKLLLAEYSYECLSKIDGIELGPSPQLSVITFRLKAGDKETSSFMNRLNAIGEAFFSSTILFRKTFIRMCILSFRSHKKEVDRALGSIRQAITSS